MKWNSFPLKVTVKNKLKTWTQFLMVSFVMVLAKMLVIDTPLSSQLVINLNMNLIFQLTLVMEVLSLLMVNSLSVLIKIFGKAENPRFSISLKKLNLACIWWLLPEPKDVVMALLLGDSELIMENGNNFLMLISINKCVHLNQLS
jgi:hypothetical protein